MFFHFIISNMDIYLFHVYSIFKKTSKFPCYFKCYFMMNDILSTGGLKLSTALASTSVKDPLILSGEGQPKLKVFWKLWNTNNFHCVSADGPPRRVPSRDSSCRRNPVKPDRYL